MKKALADVLPQEILNRKKRGFGAPMGAWLKRELAPLLRSVLSSRVGRSAAVYFRYEPIAPPDRRPSRRTASTAPTGCWRCSTSRSGAGYYLDRRGASRTSPIELRGDRGVKILYVCHRFPFPPKRGGKIRPFNMIRHLSQSPRGDGVLARPVDAEAEEGARHRAVLRRVRHEPGRRTACRRCAWSRGCRRTVPSSIGFFYSATLDATIRRLLARAALRPDLRPLLVGRAVRRARRATFRRSSTSATWIRRSGSSTRATSRFRWRRLLARRREARSRGEAPRATLRLLHGDDARRVGDAARLRHRHADRLVSERRRQRLLRPGARSRTTPTRSAFVGRMDYYPNQECMIEFCTRTCCRCCARRVRT